MQSNCCTWEQSLPPRSCYLRQRMPQRVGATFWSPSVHLSRCSDSSVCLRRRASDRGPPFMRKDRRANTCTIFFPPSSLLPSHTHAYPNHREHVKKTFFGKWPVIRSLMRISQVTLQIQNRRKKAPELLNTPDSIVSLSASKPQPNRILNRKPPSFDSESATFVPFTGFVADLFNNF